MRPATIAAHAGRPEGPGAALNAPIDLSSTYREGGRHVYGRDDNATWEAFEAGLGAMEGGAALAFGSGLAAISAVFETMPIGAKLLIGSYWMLLDIVDAIAMSLVTHSSVCPPPGAAAASAAPRAPLAPLTFST